MTVNNPITPTPNPSPTVVLPLLIPISPQNTRATMLTSNHVRSASRGADGRYSSRLVTIQVSRRAVTVSGDVGRTLWA